MCVPCSSHFSGEQLGEVHFLQFELLPLWVRSLVLDVLGINLKSSTIPVHSDPRQ